MKYAPVNDAGLKPWVVTFRSWGNARDHLVYAATARDAEYAIKGRQRHCSANARRATQADIDVLSQPLREPEAPRG